MLTVLWDSAAVQCQLWALWLVTAWHRAVQCHVLCPSANHRKVSKRRDSGIRCIQNCSMAGTAPALLKLGKITLESL